MIFVWEFTLNIKRYKVELEHSKITWEKKSYIKWEIIS